MAGETIRFEPEPPPMKIGDSVTLISPEGVTLLEVAEADESGGILRVVGYKGLSTWADDNWEDDPA